MLHIQTQSFGEMKYSPDAVFQFPQGMPGYEAEHSFVFLKQPAAHPVMFMQSVSRPDLCFTLLPVLAADSRYRLRLPDEDLTALQLPANAQPRIGKDIFCAVPVRTGHDERPEPAANLLAPILVNLKRQVGISDAVRIILPSSTDVIGSSRGTTRALLMGRGGEGFLIGEGIEIEVRASWDSRDRLRITAPEPAVLQRKKATLAGDGSKHGMDGVWRQNISSSLRRIAFQSAVAPVNTLTISTCN